MFEGLRDPFWQFIIIILLTAIAIGVPILLYIFQKNKKMLSYEILSDTSILTNKEELFGRIEVFFDKKPVSNVKIIILKIINSGNIPIPSSDYETPIKISFINKGEILTAEVIEKNPEQIDQPISFTPAQISLIPVLFNSGDYINLKILSTHIVTKIKVDGRIIGVKEIKETVEPVYGTITTLIGLVVIFFSMILTFFSIYYSIYIIFGYLLILLGVMSSKKLRSKKLRTRLSRMYELP